MSRAASIIQAEHRTLAAVLHGLLYLLGKIEKGRYEPDFRLFRAMLYYIDAFPEQLHHPKEDDFLYATLRERAPELVPVLNELEDEHKRGERLVRELQQKLVRYEQTGNAAFAEFAAAARDYANFHWEHMRKEEDVVLPAAEEKLDAADWAKIDEAFSKNNDPIEGQGDAGEFEALFARITQLAPEPIGVGPRPV